MVNNTHLFLERGQQTKKEFDRAFQESIEPKNLRLDREPIEKIGAEIELIKEAMNDISKKISSEQIPQEFRYLHYDLREKPWRREELFEQNPSPLNIKWFEERGDGSDLYSLKLRKKKSQLDGDAELHRLIENAERSIEDRIFRNPSIQVYQVFASEQEIRNIVDDVIVIESYASFCIISFSVHDPNKIEEIKKTLPLFNFNYQSLGQNEMPYLKEQIVKFRFPVRQEWKQHLIDTGVRILAPLGNSEFVTSIPNAETLKQIQKFREVDSIRPYQPTIHVDEEHIRQLNTPVSPETVVELAHLEGEQCSPPPNYVLPGLLIAGFFTSEARNNAIKTLEAQDITIVSRPGKQKLIIDLINHPQPLEAYEVIKNLSELAYLEEDSLAMNFADSGSGGSATPVIPRATVGAIPDHLTGAGEIIAIADTGLDIGDITHIHSDFQGKVIDLISYPITDKFKHRVNNPNSDNGPGDRRDGHGTHVAGCALGNNHIVQGAAHEAHLIFQAFEQTPHWRSDYINYLILTQGCIPPAFANCGIPDYLPDLFSAALSKGAYIHSNSWGTPANCVDKCRDVNEFIWEHKEFLIIFAAGNDGKKGQETVTDPGTAKNCLTVGTRSNYSSRGPCVDGRLKPDVLAMGDDIYSTCSRYSCNNGFSHIAMTGTSMATPVVAGYAALLRQYLRQDRSIPNPSAALLKAALIHAALFTEDYDTLAINYQGWGEVNLSNIITQDYAVEFFDQSEGFIDSGETDEYELEVIDESKPLRVTLVYTDNPMRENLVNNLNLQVHSSEGKYFIGNHFFRDTPDNCNNVENCLIEIPSPSNWKIKVIASGVAEPSQDYALVISGKIQNFRYLRRKVSTQ
jgi:hypothetical protein